MSKFDFLLSNVNTVQMAGKYKMLPGVRVEVG